MATRVRVVGNKARELSLRSLRGQCAVDKAKRNIHRNRGGVGSFTCLR